MFNFQKKEWPKGGQKYLYTCVELDRISLILLITISVILFQYADFVKTNMSVTKLGLL